jgi:hypothetical protein
LEDEVKIWGRMAAVGLALLLGGCGDSESTTVQLTKARFIERGDKICAAATESATQAVKAAAKNLEPGEAFTTAEQEKILRTKTLPAMQSAARQLTQLATRTGEEKAEEVAAELEDGIEKAIENPRQVLVPVESHGELADKVRMGREMAKDYGFERCTEI